MKRYNSVLFSLLVISNFVWASPQEKLKGEGSWRNYMINTVYPTVIVLRGITAAAQTKEGITGLLVGGGLIGFVEFIHKTTRTIRPQWRH